MSSGPKFWKPGAAAPGLELNEERSTAAEATVTAVFNPNSSLSIQKQRQSLPIFSFRNHVLYLVENYKTVIIVGETGCGKSTQIPQYLLEGGWAEQGHQVVVTQPRRVAAVTLANRVAEERGAILGQEVGYLIRFDDVSHPVDTRLRFLTDGMLISEMMKDPLLKKYSVVMLDEAHERSLNTDIAIGLLKKIQRKRDDLRVIVASATLDAVKFHAFFNTNTSGDPTKDTAYCMSVEGRMWPVDVHYSIDPIPDYVKATVDTVVRLHETEAAGDVLAFLTGMEEVEQVVRDLITHAKTIPKDGRKMRVLPMYGGLPAKEQMRVFERTHHNCRKVVVATNIAETSVTIPGIVFVIDCGFVKIKAYNPDTGIEALVTVPVSQAAAEQRAGRAGRIRSGKVYRLYPQSEYELLAAQTVPEMRRTDMAAVVLQLKALGVANILRFDFLSPPPAKHLIRGLELLFALGAIDDRCELTQPLGLRMAEFPLAPMFAKLLLESGECGCSQEAAIIAAMMQVNNVFVAPSGDKIAARRAHRKFAVEEGDHLTMLNVFTAFVNNKEDKHWCHKQFLNYKGLIRAKEIEHQLSRLLQRLRVPRASCGDDTDSLRRCVVTAFFANAAKRTYTGSYLTIRDEHELHIHPTSVLANESPPPKWVVFNEIVHTSKEFMRDVTVIRPEWLTELAPHFYEFGTDRELAAKRAKNA